MMRWSWVLLIAAMAACSGGSSSPSPSPTIDVRAQAEATAGFPVTLPSRLPSDVLTTPRIVVNTEKRVAIDYTHKSGATGAQAPGIQITEQKQEIHHAGVTYTPKTLAGVEVQCGETSPAAGGATAAIDCFWQQPDKYVSALFSWGTKTAPVELSDEMRRVADDVISSIIEASALRASAGTGAAPSP